MIPLGERLRLIADMVPKGAAVCDIGCDHGYLAITLLKTGRASSVIAADLRPMPLGSAEKNAVKFGVSLDLRCCDGLSGIASGEADTVIIAGMGGEVIAGILSRCDWVRDKNITLLLQAMTSAEALRDYLAGNGFDTETEPAVRENGKVYSVIKAKFSGKARKLSESERYIGAVSADSDAGKAYIKKQIKRLSDCAGELAALPQKRNEYMIIKSAVEEMERLLEGDYAV